MSNVFKVAIIGGGNMGSIIHELIPDSIIITRQTFLTTLWDQYNCIVFAIKPQDFKTLSPLPFASKLIISVMASITTGQINTITGSNQIIRCMPNTTIQVGVGMTVWCQTNQVTPDQTNWFTKLLTKKTKLLQVENDDWIDKSTAISGCGPAYLLTILQIYMSAAQDLGFTPEQSKLLVEQTYKGTLALIENNQEDIETLKNRLATKGGITEEALKVFEKNNLSGIWREAIQVAYQRAKDLSHS
ncbi:MAG: pyrroline-5-carboxylate reductase dimerization domain-containing protein [Patescibacteria group bacterium]|jgi:pyrroline-5-carboxylate reductase